MLDSGCSGSEPLGLQRLFSHTFKTSLLTPKRYHLPMVGTIYAPDYFDPAVQNVSSDTTISARTRFQITHN